MSDTDSNSSKFLDSDVDVVRYAYCSDDSIDGGYPFVSDGKEDDENSITLTELDGSISLNDVIQEMSGGMEDEEYGGFLLSGGSIDVKDKAYGGCTKNKAVTMPAYGGSIDTNDKDITMPAHVEDILANVSLTESICRNDNGNILSPCSCEPVLDLMEMIVKDNNLEDVEETKISDNINLNKLATYTKCTNEKCVLESSIVKTRDTKQIIDDNIDSNIKPSGPRNNTSWLSNDNIESAFDMYKESHPEFVYYPCSLMDFDTETPEMERTTILDQLRNGYRVIACILNTATKPPGEHWVTFLVDCRNRNRYTIEYFNSTGHKPPKPVVKLMQKTEEYLNEWIKERGYQTVVEQFVNTKSHQNSNTECGMYSCYYVLARLEDISIEKFKENPIPDDAMIMFRRRIFSSSK